MDNQPITDDIDSLVSEDAPKGSLLDYIRGQQFEEVPADEVVSPAVSEQSVAQPAVAGQNDSPEAAAATTDQGVTPPSEVPVDPEKQRLLYENQRLAQERDAERQRIAEMARLASQREEALFEQSIASLDDEDKEVARLKRQAEVNAKNALYWKSQYDATHASNEAAQQQAAKAIVVTKVMGTHGFGEEYRAILEAAETPHQMMTIASNLLKIAPRPAAQGRPAAQAPTPEQLVVGGDAAPATTRTTRKRSGDLIGLMAERPYMTVTQR